MEAQESKLKPPKIRLTWEQFDQDMNKWAQKIFHITVKYDLENLYAVPRGGAAIALKLSHLLELPILTREEDITKKTLIIDDIYDTGHTLENLKSKYPSAYLGAWVLKKNYEVCLDTWEREVRSDSGWIIFPWEV